MKKYEEMKKIFRKKILKIFIANMWDPNTINCISVEFDQNGELKGLINYDEEMFILKNIWIRNDLRNTGFTQDFLRRVFKEYTFTFVWQPNISLIKAMVKGDLGVHKKIQRMDVWCLIPQMISDVSLGYISKQDYLIKKNNHYYTMETGPDNESIIINPRFQILKNITLDECDSIIKNGEIIIKKTNLIRKHCNDAINIKVQEFYQEFTKFEGIQYNKKLERSQSVLNKYFEETIQKFEDRKKGMKYVDTE